MRTQSPVLFALAIVLTQAGGAWAQSGQPWLDDRRLGQGIGIRQGDLELHPGVAAQVGYDSNPLQNSGDVGFINEGGTDFELTEPVIDVARLRITPSLAVQTLGAQRDAGPAQTEPPQVNFKGQASLGYNALFLLGGALENHEGLGNYFDGKGALNLDILPERPWGGDINAAVTRIVQPNNDPGLPPAFSRTVLQGGFGVIARPGGGKVSGRLGYEANATLFESAQFAGYSNLAHSLQLAGHWKFLPRTALLYEGRMGFVGYAEGSALANSKPLSTKLGLAGLLSNHVSLLTMLGWMATFYEPRDGVSENYDGPVGQVELTYYPSPQVDAPVGSAVVGLSTVAIGYLRSIENAYLGNYVRRDRLYTEARSFIAGMAVLALQGGVSVLGRPPSVLGDNPEANDRLPAFSETRVDATAFAELRTSNTFGLNATLIYNAALSNQVLRAQAESTVLPGDAIPVDNLRYDRYELWLGARWFL